MFPAKGLLVLLRFSHFLGQIPSYLSTWTDLGTLINARSGYIVHLNFERVGASHLLLRNFAKSTPVVDTEQVSDREIWLL